MICLDKDSQNTESSETGILKLLRILLSGMVDVEKKKLILNDDFDIKKDIHIEEELNAMCNISEGIRSIALEQGIEQGIEQGEKNKQIDSLKKLIKNLHLTFEQAADALELSEEERESLAAMI
jgi:predicted transposase YdaD